jgi:hypothetical protein
MTAATGARAIAAGIGVKEGSRAERIGVREESRAERIAVR